jgi:hypothetical protein
MSERDAAVTRKTPAERSREYRKRKRDAVTEALVTPETVTPVTPDVRIKSVAPAVGITKGERDELVKITRERGRVPRRASRPSRPNSSPTWRGNSQRRAELRKFADAGIDAIAKQARLTIDAQVADTVADLLAGSLTSEAAREHLSKMPEPRSLMSPLEVAGLKQLAAEAVGR